MKTPRVADAKAQWFFSHVDVEFPTALSLVGQILYAESLQDCLYQPIQPRRVDAATRTSIYPVDFHRLTIMFAQLQATAYLKPADQEAILEFFTQIILSPPCQLYLSFEQGRAIAAGVVTIVDHELLVSDIVMEQNQLFSSPLDFAQALVETVGISDAKPSDLKPSDVKISDNNTMIYLMELSSKSFPR